MTTEHDAGRRSVARLDEHDAAFRRLLRVAQDRYSGGRYESAAAHAQVAAGFAWLNHTGWFASPDLERLLRDIGSRLPDVPDRPDRRLPSRATPRTVHVLSQAYQTGGPTQYVASWIDHAPGEHVVCLTRQMAVPVPEKIKRRMGPRVRLLRLDRSGGLLRRARLLRAAAQDADLVLLNVHPHDAVPVLAFAKEGPRPPITYVNQADHTFWLGVAAADRVLHMRDSGRELAHQRRGVESRRSLTIPRPLRLPTRTMPREEARRAAGISPEQVVLLTVADGAKYRVVDGPSLIDVVEPVVRAFPHVVFLAAGPSPEEAQWRDASERTGGRIRALGLLPDPAAVQQAADVYLDSFPFASLTSLLEAAAYGVPVLTYRGHPDGCDVFGSDTPGVTELMFRPSTPQEAFDDLRALVRDPGLRDESGRRIAEAILATHTGAGWVAAAAPLYEPLAPQDLVPPPVPSVERRTHPVDELVDRVMSRSIHSRGVTGALHSELGLLPTGERTTTWLREAAAGRTPPLRTLPPEWTLPPMAEVSWWWKARLRRRPS